VVEEEEEEEEARVLEEEEEKKKKKEKKVKLMKDIAHEYTVRTGADGDGEITDMREYHVDAHPSFFEKYVNEENKKFGGNLSVRKQPGERAVLLIGQDESIFHQFLFSKKGWVGAKGESVLRPKSEGEGYMISAFVSRLWGFNEILSNMVLTDEVLEKVNARRKGKHYVSTEAAEEVYGRTLKEDIIDYSPLVHLFEYGAEKKGYWNYNHMALQVEDLMDCLPVLYPDFDFVLLFDQSSGHGKSQKGGLYASNMGKSWGGTQPIMRPSELTEGGCLGPFGARMIIGDVQEMNFQRIENGLFYMDNTEREERRDDKPVPNMTEKSKRKKVDILKDLRVKTGLLYRGFLSVDEVHKLASDHNVPIEVVKQKIEPGWVDKPKGLLQVLWERGWIDESNLSKYSKEGKAAWFDQKTKEVKPEFES
jgi:hypothetical protein